MTKAIMNVKDLFFTVYQAIEKRHYRGINFCTDKE